MAIKGFSSEEADNFSFLLNQKREKKAPRVICCQISNQLINPSKEERDKSAEYFDALYSKVDGYYRPKDFWEVPNWIAKVSESIPKAKLHIVRNIQESIEFLRKEKADYVLFSVMEVNKGFIKEIIQALPEQEFILGGYIPEEYFAKIGTSAYRWFYTLQSAIEFMGFEYKSGYSYKLFQGMKTIPRLMLSTGCKNHCSFCTIEKEVVETSYPEIFEQALSFKELDFKLVYLNDKTFGQAKNYTVLPCVFNFIKSFNPSFEGFVIQTTATQFNRFSPGYLKDSHIVLVEIGVESFNDSVLKRLRKPSRENQIESACEYIRHSFKGMKLIPNIVVGLAGEGWKETSKTYQNTLDFLRMNKDIISHVNVTLFSVYEGTQSFKELSKGLDSDSDQGTLEKSWLGEKYHQEFYNKVLEFGLKQIKERGGK